MAIFKVYITDYDYPDNEIEKSVLEPIGAEVIGLQCKTGEGLAELAQDADALLQQYAKIPRATIEKLKKCKAICRYGVGVDIVDVKAAYEHGMVVTNVADYCLDEVADHSIALGFMLLRRIPFFVNAAKAGKWHWSVSGAPIRRYRGLTWGLIGCGRIAQNTARKVQTFGFNVISYDPYVSQGYMNSHGIAKTDLNTLVKTADVVDVTCPHTEETYHIINEERLRVMKPDAVLINCARGKLVDNKALYRALTEGWIASAGMDDPEEEPAKMDNWTADMNPLFKLDNCFITPHVAYVSEASLEECRRTASENAKAVLLGQTPPNLVKPV
jgi:D-3-phosphoglycerate dehydrogenase / 2-oxoglutarate reductase